MKKRKILVIPGYRIFPIDSGGAHGQLTFIEKQQEQYDLHILLLPENINHADIPAFQQRFPHLKLVPLGFKPTKGFKAFIAKNLRKFSGKDFSYLARKVGFLNGHLITEPHLLQEVSNYINSNQFDLIQVEHIRNAGLVSILPASTKKIFIQHEVGFTRVYADMKSLSYPDAYAKYLSSFTEGAEVFWMTKYDGIITFNKNDVSLLKERGINVPMEVASPFALFDDELNYVYDSSQKQKLIFIGGEEHYPNKEGLTWFLENIYPHILDKKKDTELLVTSKWTDDYKNKYSGANVKFTGFVENLDDLLKSSILITPIRIGSGIRVKVFTSMAKGIPVVSTTLGASGIPELSSGENILLADEEVEFADKVMQLLDDEGLRKKISMGSFELSKKNFSALQFVEMRNRFYVKIWNDGGTADIQK